MNIYSLRKLFWVCSLTFCMAAFLSACERWSFNKPASPIVADEISSPPPSSSVKPSTSNTASPSATTIVSSHSPSPSATASPSPTQTACTYSLSVTTASMPAAGGTGSVAVTTQQGCAWTATSNAAFVSITGGSSGSSSGMVNYAVAANPSATNRSGTLTIAGRSVTITQPAAPDTTGPTLSITQPVNGLTVTTATITVSGTASDPSGIYSVTVNGASASGTTTFSAIVNLVQGANTITIVARDNSANRNATTQTRTVTYTPPVEKAVTLQWDPIPANSGVSSYKIYLGTVSGTYTQNIDAGNATQYRITGLVSGTRYYAAIRAYSQARTLFSGLSAESGYSNVVSFVFP